MSAAPRTVSTAPDLRALGLALGAVLIAVAVIVAVALVRPTSTKAPTAPAAPAAVQFDHGWSSAAAGTRSLTVQGTKGGGINYTGIPYPARDTTDFSNIQMSGIPAQALDRTFPIGTPKSAAQQTYERTFPIVVAKGYPYQNFQQTYSNTATPAHSGKGTMLAR